MPIKPVVDIFWMWQPDFTAEDFTNRADVLICMWKHPQHPNDIFHYEQMNVSNMNIIELEHQVRALYLLVLNVKRRQLHAEMETGAFIAPEMAEEPPYQQVRDDMLPVSEGDDRAGNDNRPRNPHEPRRARHPRQLPTGSQLMQPSQEQPELRGVLSVPSWVDPAWVSGGTPYTPGLAGSTPGESISERSVTVQNEPPRPTPARSLAENSGGITIGSASDVITGMWVDRAIEG